MSSYYGYNQQQQPQQPNGGGNFYNSGGAYGGGASEQQQFQQSQQQPQQQQYGAGGGTQQQWQQPHQQTQQPQQQNFWSPTMTAATMMNVAAATQNPDAMLDLASSAGKTFLQSGTARMIPGMQGYMGHLRTYFAVDNRYVKRKMQKVLFPFLSKTWKRIQSSPGPDGTIDYALPFTDENAPDLYLPCMSLITYGLLCALCYGTAGQFSPEVLPDVTIKCMVTQAMEVAAIRFGFYMMQAPVNLLDLFSYTGYKYLGLSINMLVGLLLLSFWHSYGHRGYYICFLITASAQSYFMLKTMSNNIPRVTSSTGPKREFMVLGFAASQFATMWFVSQTKFLK